MQSINKSIQKINEQITKHGLRQVCNLPSIYRMKKHLNNLVMKMNHRLLGKVSSVKYTISFIHNPKVEFVSQ